MTSDILRVYHFKFESILILRNFTSYLGSVIIWSSDMLFGIANLDLSVWNVTHPVFLILRSSLFVKHLLFISWIKCLSLVIPFSMLFPLVIIVFVSSASLVVSKLLWWFSAFGRSSTYKTKTNGFECCLGRLPFGFLSRLISFFQFI